MKLLTFETEREENMIFNYHYKELDRCRKRCSRILIQMLEDVNNNSYIFGDFSALQRAKEEMMYNKVMCEGIQWAQQLRNRI